jgi:hypothetical protein
MTALAAAPLPFIAAATLLGLAMICLIAKAVFAPTDDPARRLCAIIAALRRRDPRNQYRRRLLSRRPVDVKDSNGQPLTISAPPRAAAAPGRRSARR